MFLQSCYINLNTKKLRDKLKEIGYNCMFIKSQDMSRSGVDKHNSIQCVNEAINGKAVDFYEHPDKGINCEKNEKLFLALAALNDKDSFEQWFVSDADEWYLNHYPELRLDIAEWVCSMDSKDWHKATVEEIIKHFKK